MKKIALIMAALILALSLASCGEKQNASAPESVQSEASQPAGWISNEYTDNLPAVPEGLTVSDTYSVETGFSVMLRNADINKAQAYSETLKKTFTAESSGSVFAELDMCLFTGKNAAGYTVEMIYSAGTLAVTVKK